MKLNRLSVIKLLTHFAIVFISMGFYHIADEPAIEIHPAHTSFYQERPCNYSIFELLSEDRGTYDIVFTNSPNGDVECFGKNSWYEYNPEKLIENGWKEYEKDYIKIWLSTNISVDLLVQSIFWLIIILFKNESNLLSQPSTDDCLIKLSKTIKPTLCLVILYLSPGLPSPTKSFMDK